MRIRLNQQIRSYNNYANFRVGTFKCYPEVNESFGSKLQTDISVCENLYTVTLRKLIDSTPDQLA